MQFCARKFTATSPHPEMLSNSAMTANRMSGRVLVQIPVVNHNQVVIPVVNHTACGSQQEFGGGCFVGEGADGLADQGHTGPVGQVMVCGGIQDDGMAGGSWGQPSNIGPA